MRRHRLAARVLTTALLTIGITGCGIIPRASQGDIAFCTVVERTYAPSSPATDSQSLQSATLYLSSIDRAKDGITDGRLEGLRLSLRSDVVMGYVTAAEAKTQLLARCRELRAL